MAEGVTTMCRVRQRINNDLLKSYNKHQCVCLRHHVCSTSLYTAAVFCNPVGLSQSIPHREMAHQRSNHASPRRHWVRLPSCRNSEISTPLNLQLLSPPTLHTPAHWCVPCTLNENPIWPVVRRVLNMIQQAHTSILVCTRHSKWLKMKKEIKNDPNLLNTIRLTSYSSNCIKGLTTKLWKKFIWAWTLC